MRVRRRYHGGLTTLLLVGLVILLGIGALTSENNLLFLVFGITLGAGIASGFLSGAMMMGLRAERLAPHAGAVGQPMVVRYVVTNSSRWMPAFALRVEEVSWDSRGPAARESWTRLLHRPVAFVAYLPPRGRVEVSAVVTPIARGVAHLSAVRVSSAFPFGLVRKSCSFEDRRELPVQPRVARLRSDATSRLVSRADLGATATALRGRGDEFYGLREYTPGDSPRLIAWRSSARLGSLVVRENTAPAAGQVWVLLHLGASQGGPREDAIVLAASLIAHAQATGVEPGLSIVDKGVSIAPASGGGAGRAVGSMMIALARLDEPADAERNTRDPGAAIPPRATSIVVHAEAVDPTLGPEGARHVSARDLASLTVGSASDRAGDAA